MRKTNFTFMLVAFLAIFLVSSVSAQTAQVVFGSQPSSSYNLGDMAKVPVNIATASPVSDFFTVYLICNGVQTQVYQEYLSLSAGDQKSVNVLTPPLSPALVGGQTGTCKLKAMLGEGYQLTSDFRVTDVLTVKMTSNDTKFKPGQQVVFEGNAVKQNGKDANGIAWVNITSGNDSVYTGSGTVSNGFFRLNFTLPSDLAAGVYSSEVGVYESDSLGATTNHGAAAFKIKIAQIPTSLELVFYNQNSSIMPGATLKVKAILHDQTGAKINSSADFTITDESGQAMDQETKDTGSYIGFHLAYNSPPAIWTVNASSNGLNTKSQFTVLANPNVSVDFINRTLVVTNVGNVPYEKPLFVNLGNESVVFNVSLGVDKSQKYVLSAPNGNYSVKISNGNSNLFSGDISLTGNAIGVEQASSGIISIVRYPLVWIFVVLVLAFVAFMLFRRIRKKSFFGKANLNKQKPRNIKSAEEKISPAAKDSVVSNPETGRADMSLSIQGDKQDAAVVCLNIKNLEELRSGKGGAKETLDSIQKISDSSKSVIYENGNYLFFIFAPVKTKTFSNEKNAVQAAEQIRQALDNHNKLFRQKMDFGISINRGTIIAKQFGNSIKFMSLGNFSSTAKKLANVSGGEVLISTEVRERLMSDVKTEKGSTGDMEYYVLSEIKDRSRSEKFIKDFMNKMEREKREKKE